VSPTNGIESLYGLASGREVLDNATNLVQVRAIDHLSLGHRTTYHTTYLPFYSHKSQRVRAARIRHLDKRVCG
jgi:hypothetical protein